MSTNIQPGTQPKSLDLDPATLHIDPAYQRTQKPVHKRIMKNFKWTSFGSLVVANRNGRYFVVDGQQRLAAVLALIEAGKLPANTKVPCRVSKSTSSEAEARTFSDINTVRTSTNPHENWNADLHGKIEDAVAINACLKNHKMTVTPDRNSWNQVSCIRALRNSYKLLGGTKGLNRLLTILNGAWSGIMGMTDGDIILGLTQVLRLEPGLDDQRLTQVIRGANKLEEILDTARSNNKATKANSGYARSTWVAAAIEDLYNNKLKKIPRINIYNRLTITKEQELAALTN